MRSETREVREHRRAQRSREVRCNEPDAAEEVRSRVPKDRVGLASFCLLLSWLVSVRMLRDEQRQRQLGVFCQDPPERECCAFI